MLRVRTVNVGTMPGRSREVVDMLVRRRVDVCCVQEVRYKGEGATTIGSSEEKFKFGYSGYMAGGVGVGVLVRHELAWSVVEVERFSHRVMKVKIVIRKVIYQFFSVYASQVGRSDEKSEFWENLEDEVAEISGEEGVIVGGDMNGYIGAMRVGHEEVVGCFGYGVHNHEGMAILDFGKNQNLAVLYTLFKKDREKYITYKSGDAETHLNLILLRKGMDIRATYCKVIIGEACLTQHRLVCANIQFKYVKKKMWKLEKKIIVWKLKDETTRRLFEERFEEITSSTGEWKDLLAPPKCLG